MSLRTQLFPTPGRTGKRKPIRFFFSLLFIYLFIFLIFYWIIGFGVHEQSMQDSCVGTHMAVCFAFLLPLTHIWHFPFYLFIVLIKMGFHHVGQAGFELPTSGDPPASASQNVLFIFGNFYFELILDL